MWHDDRTIVGASDAGAHLDLLATFNFSTSLLATSRERKIIELPEAIRQLTDFPARTYGLTERGRLEEGWHADITVFDPETAPERFGADGASPQVCADDGYCYTAFVRGDTLYQRETRPDTPGWERVYAASHVVGSGNATRSYLMTVGDADSTAAYVTEMPLTWYVERSIWDLSPGYRDGNARFDRPITLDCLTCHNARPAHETSQNFYTDVPLGISCERCHGPGSAHVAAFESGGEPTDTRIVNPAALPTAWGNFECVCLDVTEVPGPPDLERSSTGL